MKIGIAVLLIFGAVASDTRSGEVLRADELFFSETDRSWHKTGERVPFTGTVLTYEHGERVARTAYNNGKQNGPFKRWEVVTRRFLGLTWKSRLVREEGFWKDGELDGRHVSRHRNGTVSYETFYRNGRADGERKGWSDNGTLTYRCLYVDGKRQGEELQWSAIGILKGKNVYSNEVVVEANYYHADGTPAKIVGFSENGAKISYIKEWDAEGREIIHHADTHPDGTATTPAEGSH